MPILILILKAAVVTVLSASLLEAVVLSLVRGWRQYDWKATSFSLVDFLVREYPLAWLLPLPFWRQAMGWIYDHRLVTVPMTAWWGWALCFLAQEFCYYWYHRSAHRIRWFWCTHAIHHGPEQLNLSAAYRFGWTGKLTGSLAFFMLAPLFGLPPGVVLVLFSLNLLYQFWIHATWIPRLGPLEWVLNTPSAHRAHHASNTEYLDCNYGGVLIVFDRLFGTYVAERRDEPCRYGLTTPIKGDNIIEIEFGQWMALVRDLRLARSASDVLGYVLGPPGWHPAGSSETTTVRRLAAGLPARRSWWRSLIGQPR